MHLWEGTFVKGIGVRGAPATHHCTYLITHNDNPMRIVRQRHRKQNVTVVCSLSSLPCPLALTIQL